MAQQRQRRKSSAQMSQLTFQLQAHPSQHNPYSDTMSSVSSSPPYSAQSPPAFPGSPPNSRTRTSSVPQPKALTPFVPDSGLPTHGELNGSSKSSGVRALLLENVSC
jgi:hypothetical protein